MRVAFLLAGLVVGSLLPQLVAAQAAGHQADYYILTDSLGHRHRAEVRLLSDDAVSIKEPTGTKHTLHAPSIAFFQSVGEHFYSLGNFEVQPGNPNSRVKRVFVELVDSGQVVLYRYVYTTAKLRPMLVSGAILPGLGTGETVLYLLQTTGSTQLTPFPTDRLIGGSRYFSIALQPYLAERLDLLTPLLVKHLHPEDLRDIVRALNAKQPFVRTNRTPFGVD